MSTVANLKKAIVVAEKIESLQAEIADLQAQLQGMFGIAAAPVAQVVEQSAPATKKRKMSAAGRAAIVAAQKARWAAKKGGAVPAKADNPVKKRKMSAAGRAAIVAAQKARWAAKKAGKAAPVKAEKPAKKKRTMSPEVRAKLAAAMKARWAAAKKSGGPAPTASKKKK